MGKYESEHAKYRRYTQRVQTRRSVCLSAICQSPGSLFRVAGACVGCGWLMSACRLFGTNTCLGDVRSSTAQL